MTCALCALWGLLDGRELGLLNDASDGRPPLQNCRGPLYDDGRRTIAREVLGRSGLDLRSQVEANTIAASVVACVPARIQRADRSAALCVTRAILGGVRSLLLASGIV